MRRAPCPVRGWQMIVVSAATSPIGGALVAAEALEARGRRAAARTLRLVVAPLAALALAWLALQPRPWTGLAATLLAASLASGLLYAWIVHDPRPRRARRRRDSATWTAIGGSVVASQVGAGLGVLYLLVMDRFVSTLFPSVASRFGAFQGVLRIGMDLGVVGAVAGAILARSGRRMTLPRILWAMAGGAVAYFLARALGVLLIGVPTFHGWALTGAGEGMAVWRERLLVSVPLWLFTGALGCAAAVLLAGRPRGRHAEALALVALLSVAGVGSLVVYSGRTSYGLLLGGVLAETRGRLDAARGLYERGLAQRSEDGLAAYLQFRLAMLSRQDGDLAAARAGLSRVVTRYAARPKLVARAQHFLSALERAPEAAPRRIIAGVRAPTEFKSAYCVPNSVGLVLHHWNVPLTPKAIGRDITAIDLGTQPVDLSWYLDAKGLRHWTMPLAGIDDVKRFVDRDIPVLIYVPQHVLAVVGYDEAFDSLVTYDVAEEEIWVDHPIDELLPQWKRELAIIGVVLPAERFAELPAAERASLERWTAAYTHHLLHHRYHHSPDARDQERALAQLDAAVEQAPEFFFAVSHVLARPAWAARRREAWAARYDLAATALRGAEFVRHNFDDDETLRELARLLLDVGQEKTLYELLTRRSAEGTLAGHPDLAALLGRIEFRHGDAAAAIAHLSPLEGPTRNPLVLGRALEARGSWQAALTEYRRVVDPSAGEQREEVRRWQERQPPPPLWRRRAALARLLALADEHRDPEPVRAAVRSYLAKFPWDPATQAWYVRSIGEALGRPDLPRDTRRELQRDLRRALGVLGTLDPAARARAASLDALLGPS